MFCAMMLLGHTEEREKVAGRAFLLTVGCECAEGCREFR